MKLYKSFLMGGLAMLAFSCAEDIEPSIPQHNEQEPIFEASGVESSKAGVLASNAVLNLESYKAFDKIPVVTLDKAEGLPEGAAVSYKVQLSSSDTFDRTITLPAEAEESSREGAVTYYVSADAWNAAHVELFGKSPKEKTMYYRVPCYIDIDGSDYRLNDVNYYVAEGSLQETCYDMGFVIEDAYYFLSNATTWDLGNAEEVEKYAFDHDPNVSPYDDPVFTFTFVLSQESLDANGGGCWWKIAPKSAVGTQDWDKMVGTEVDSDTELSGMLVTSNAGSGKLDKPGRYEVKINMESMHYEITLMPNALFLVGNANGWNIDNGALYLTETALGSNVYMGVLKVNAGDNYFRFYTKLGDWGSNVVGASESDSNNQEVSFTGGVYESNVVQGGNGNWFFNKDWAGAVDITVDLNTNKITMKETSVGGIYLRGGMNGWGTDPAYEFQLTDKISVWQTGEVSIDGGVEFKVADADWGAINYGGDGMVVPGEPFNLVHNAGNLKMEANFTGKAVLTRNGENYTLVMQ